MSDTDADEHLSDRPNQKGLILIRIDALSRQVGSLEKKVDAFVEKVHANEIWRERVDNRLIVGNEHMTAHDRVYDLIEKKIEINTERFNTQKTEFNTLLEAKYIAKSDVKWMMIGVAIATSGSLIGVLKMLGIRL